MRTLLDLLFPPRCLSCDEPGSSLCARCDGALPWITHACRRCAMPAPAPCDGCAACRGGSFAFDEARAAFRYEGVARDALLAFKLAGERRAGPLLGRRMARCAPGARLVTFVPSTKRSVAARGCNPAEVLARAVAARIGVPCVPLLRKVRETPDQAGLSRAARRANLTGAFAPVGPVLQVPVLLIDDVLTTGATADACARVLRRAGAGRVGVLTFARAR